MSEEEEYDSDMDYSDNDCGYADYYNVADDCDVEIVDPSKMDVEYFVFECLTVEEVERLLNESVESLSNSVQITPSLAKVLLHSHKWCVQDIVLKYRGDSASLLVVSKIKPSRPPAPQTSTHHACDVCMLSHEAANCCGLACGHLFCNLCWSMHFEVQIAQGISTGIACMAQNCEVLAPEDFVLNLLSRPKLREKYQQFAFCDYVQSHPELRFCPGPNCQVVVRAKEPCAKRVICTACSTVFCFKCGMDYHAPTDCSTIKRWLTKCADDSETANYISAHTKDCPRCHICIEKNGGCNHMMCFSCKHDFCWMCLGDWKTHGSEYYECSRFKENPNIAQESVLVQAREALKKYLHYYERLAVDDSKSECPGVKKLLHKAKNIVGHYRRSSQARERLHSLQERMQVPQLELIQYVETRWSSEYCMLQRLVEMKGPIAAELAQSEHNIEPLTNADWAQAKGVLEVLEPLAQATKEISGDSYPTSSMVIPILHCLSSHLNSRIQRQEEANLSTALRNELYRDFEEMDSTADEPEPSTSNSGLWSFFDSLPNERKEMNISEEVEKYLSEPRWENHCKSLKLEEQTLQNIKAHIHKKVMDCSGTWIDWQYLLHAAFLLAKCRYTLQYTYPYAYYMEPGPRKELFEYQQAQLEAEIENLSWKVERAETTHRGELENQMDVAEKRRGTLLKDFLKA
uniref:RBR-type E3 ubiquitin transferase n=1 Tax=Timema shepardi TaxID=629360 RepID=A0A7R9AM55_TIMSH|nr:unnamed protein product [Timema shepardi]